MDKKYCGEQDKKHSEAIAVHQRDRLTVRRGIAANEYKQHRTKTDERAKGTYVQQWTHTVHDEYINWRKVHVPASHSLNYSMAFSMMMLKNYIV